MSPPARQVRLVLMLPFLLAPLHATAQTLVAPGVDGGGASFEDSAARKHAVSIGQLGASGSLLDASDRPRLVGGIGGLLSAESVPEPGMGSALPLAIASLAAFRLRRRAEDHRRPRTLYEDRS